MVEQTIELAIRTTRYAEPAVSTVDPNVKPSKMLSISESVSVCQTELASGAKIDVAGPEDRATLGSDLSADPGRHARRHKEAGQGHSSPAFLVPPGVAGNAIYPTSPRSTFPQNGPAHAGSPFAETHWSGLWHPVRYLSTGMRQPTTFVLGCCGRRFAADPGRARPRTHHVYRPRPGYRKRLPVPAAPPAGWPAG